MTKSLPLWLCAALAVSACAEIPCNEACTPAMRAAQESLIVEPVNYAAMFGPQRFASVTVEGVPASPQYPGRQAHAAEDPKDFTK